jgi:hypothetical protein
MWRSTFTTITSHNRPTSSEFENEWRINNLVGRPANDQIACFSNFSHTKSENTEQPGSQAFD